MALTTLEIATAAAGRERERGLGRAQKRAWGAIHTPPELAHFVARLADAALRDELSLAGGLADPRLTIVDPACGPGAFLAASLALGGSRATRPRAVWGFDVDARALAAARAGVLPSFARCGWPLSLRRADTLGVASFIDRLTTDGPVVVLGNPPWRGGPGALPAPHMQALLEDFRREPDGELLDERKLGVLADSYVRFLRWALACVERAGGVLALVTNGSFLDGPVHRAMRAKLARSLDLLEVVDLGGNALLAAGDERDENVFAVRTSVAVTVGVRVASAGRGAARVRHLALRGSAREKLETLAHIEPTDLRPLRVRPPLHLLRPVHAVSSEYAAWPSLGEAMPFHREGVQTNRDAVCIDADRDRLLARLRAFAAGRTSRTLEPAWRELPHYDPERARAAVRRALVSDANAAVVPIAYRAFDQRWLAAIAAFCHRPRPLLAAAMARSRLALVTVRKDRGSATWAHFGAVRHLVDSSYLSTRSSCRTRAFPEKTPDGNDNLAPAVARRLADVVGEPVDAHAFLCYALAVIASPAYRARHDAALRLDYPRIPWPADAACFAARAVAGRELADLLASPHADPSALRTAIAALDALFER